MKAIKIGLVIVVLAIIVFFIFRSCDNNPIETSEIVTIEKTHYQKIEDSIKSIRALPINTFSKDKYEELRSLIEQWESPAPPQHPYGRFGDTKSENDFNKNNLTSNLYAAYSQKFIEQAYNVFKGSECKYDDFNFIRKEAKTLSQSPYLKNGSFVYNSLKEIQQILNKYDEINRFINEAKNLKTPDGASAPIAVKFPIEEVNSKINQSRTYLNSNLGNSYVNNCSRLKQELRDIPNILFQKHIQYLNKKLDYWTGTYSAGYRTLTAYRDNVYSPINNEINSLSNQTYNVPDFDSRRASLRSKWELEARSAWNHFNK